MLAINGDDGRDGAHSSRRLFLGACSRSLYLWMGDVAAGQATGQDHDAGLWYAVFVDGAIGKRTQT